MFRIFGLGGGLGIDRRGFCRAGHCSGKVAFTQVSGKNGHYAHVCTVLSISAAGEKRACGLEIQA